MDTNVAAVRGQEGLPGVVGVLEDVEDGMSGRVGSGGDVPVVVECGGLRGNRFGDAGGFGERLGRVVVV